MTAHEVYSRLCERYGVDKKTYSHVSYARESGQYTEGCVYAQCFFDAYPPFTSNKITKILEISSFKRETIITNFHVKYHISNGFSVSGEGDDFRTAMADFIYNYYDYLSEDERNKVKDILSGK